MSRVDVRGAGLADLDHVMAVMGDAFDPAFGEAWTRAQCQAMISFTGTILLIAWSGEVPLGFALGRVIIDDAELLLLAVRPDERRRGVGQSLVQAMSTASRAGGAVRLHLEVRENNPARAFYGSLGFREVGRRPRYYRLLDGTMADALTLACPLDATSSESKLH